MGADMDEFITEVEWSARQILRACNKKRRNNALMTTEKQAAQEVAQSDSKSQTPCKYDIGHDNAEMIKKNGAPCHNTSNFRQNVHSEMFESPFFHQKMIKKRPGQIQLGQHHNRSEKSRILETLKEVRNISSKKQYKAKRIGRTSENCEPSEQIDLRMEVLRKKYRCELNRANAFESYLKAATIEKNMFHHNGEDGEFISKINMQLPHPIAAILSKQIDLENLRVRKNLRDKNAKKKIPVLIDAIWEGVKDHCEHFGSSSFCQIRSTSDYLFQDAEIGSGDDMEIQSVSYGYARNEEENLNFGALVVSVDAEKNIIPETNLPTLPSRMNEEVLDIRLVQNEDWISWTSDNKKKMKISVFLKVDVRKLGSDQPRRTQWSVEIFDPSTCISSIIDYSGREVRDLLDVMQQEWKCREGTTRDIEILVYNEDREFCQEETKMGAFCSIRVYRKMQQIWIHIHFSTQNDFQYDLHITTCEAVARLPLLQSDSFTSSFDFEFWCSPCNGDDIWSSLLDMVVLRRGKKIPLECSFEFAMDRAGLVNGHADQIGQLRSMYPSVYAVVNDILLENNQSSGQCVLSSRVYQKRIFVDDSRESIGWSECKRRDTLLSLQKPAYECVPNHVFSGCAYTEIKGLWWEAYSHIGAKVLIGEHHDNNRDDYYSRPVVVFKKKSRHGATHVATAMTLSSPLHAPLQRAADEQLIMPTPVPNEECDNEIPKLMATCKNLLINPLRSVVDERRPSPVTIMNYDTWDHGKKRDNSSHRENGNPLMMGDDSFRKCCIVDYLKVDRSIPPMIFGITEKGATPNKTRMCAPYIDHSKECCNDHLSRRRGYRDMLRLIRDKSSNNHGGKWSEPCLFSLHMSAYQLRSVSRCSLGENQRKCNDLNSRKSNYIRMISSSNRLKSGLMIHEKKCAEEIKKIREEIQTQGYKEFEESHVPPPAPRHPIDFPGTPSSEKYPYIIRDMSDCIAASTSSAENNDIDLGLLNLAQLPKNYCDNRCQELLKQEKDAIETTSRLSREYVIGPLHIPKLRIPHLGHQLGGLDVHTGVRGRGWRRVPCSTFGTSFFELNKHKIEKCCSSGIFQKCNKSCIIGSVDPVKGIDYRVDESLFSVSFNHLFVEDVMSDLNRMIKQKESHKKQHERSIDISISSKGLPNDGDMEANDSPPFLTQEDIFPTEDKVDMAFVGKQKAILAVKNSNISMLEQVLDFGIDVDTKDEHGNTLLILCCQQGNKRMSKFLLRRGAFINAQNIMGNTVLHYLYEYQHTMLAEYLMTKGANDKILNVEGLTCYEGLDRSKLDEL